MMGFGQRRPVRANSTQKRQCDGFEALETRQLMSGGFPTLHPGTLKFYQPTFLQQIAWDTSNNPIKVVHPADSSPRALAALDNAGRILTGKDLQGDEWEIQVHGPGYAIVSDVTPNDGVLESNIDTIQLVGTNVNTTYVTGQVKASARVITDGTIQFNHLVALNGVHSIILNGFTLAQTIAPPNGALNNTNTGIFLPGGVGLLQFHNIQAPIDLATNDQPINIIIGQANSPTLTPPIIRLDSIFNTVFDSTQLVNPNGVPNTTPTVNIAVNGELKGLQIVSSTQAPIPAGFQNSFPVVGTTGRTAVRATGVGHLKVIGSAINTTVSRTAVPFQNGFSGITHLKSAQFGGTADAVGLDVNGPIGRLKFAKGLGNPAGSLTGATNWGLPDAQRGYPSFGLLGGLVTSTKIHNVVAGPANVVLQTPQDPDFMLVHPGSTRFFHRAGNALTSAAIVAAGSIHNVSIAGNQQATEIKTGFHYPSFAKGLQGTRAPSQISQFHQKGDLIDAVVSATYRPTQTSTGGVYNPTVGNKDVAGPGLIRGRLLGRLYNIGGQTALGNRGAGIFARRKIGYLPPPENATPQPRGDFIPPKFTSGA
jgi:hypothetical protein